MKTGRPAFFRSWAQGRLAWWRQIMMRMIREMKTGEGFQGIPLPETNVLELEHSTNISSIKHDFPMHTETTGKTHTHKRAHIHTYTTSDPSSAFLTGVVCLHQLPRGWNTPSIGFLFKQDAHKAQSVTVTSFGSALDFARPYWYFLVQASISILRISLSWEGYGRVAECCRWFRWTGGACGDWWTLRPGYGEDPSNIAQPAQRMGFGTL